MADNQTEPQRQTIKIDPIHVPPELHPLFPYAEKWGITDKDLQRKLLYEAPIEEIEELCVTLYPFWDDVWNFARSHPISDKPDNEIRTFSALITAFEEAFSILDEKRPERFLEIIGWPEKFPTHSFDPAKLPSELQSLVPHIKKWVREDDYVRLVAMRAATSEELQEFVFTVDQISVETIRQIALQMVEDEMRQTEGYILLEMLELADEAESVLKSRGHSPSA